MRQTGLLQSLLPKALVVVALLAGTASLATPNPLASRVLAEDRSARFLVLLKPSADAAAETLAHASARARAAATRAGVPVASSRALSARVHLLILPHPVSAVALADTVDALRADGDIEAAQPDRRKYPLSIPNDTDFPNQWYWQSAEPAAVNMESAWSTTTGSTGTVIAVLDTGVRFDHPDLGHAESGGRLLRGYDFVGPDPDGSFVTANDGDGWDADPSDPGDWISESDLSNSNFKKCKVRNSSWHGTRTSGLIGALTNNALGIAGGTWKPWILPVRVLGKCGGFDSDIQTAMRWAAGIAVAGVPNNTYPANVENLSFGGTGACDSFYQQAVDDVLSRGTVIVASAGNDGTDVADSEPASCPGVITVAGLRQVGTKVGYSDLGSAVMLAAPAGNCGNDFVIGGPCTYSIDTTTNLGTTVPGKNSYTDQYNYSIGTSFSAPIVSAIAGLMHAVNGNLTPAEFSARLREGAAPFPTSSADAVASQPPVCTDPALTPTQNVECICTTGTCGAGMANAPGALRAAARPIAVINTPASSDAAGNVVLDATGSTAACGHRLVSYAWSATPSGSALQATSGTSTSLAAPASGSVTVHLVVTDDAGATDTADATVTTNGASTSTPGSAGSAACPASIDPNPPTLPAPPARTSSGGGGGAWPPGASLALALLVAVRSVRQRAVRRPR